MSGGDGRLFADRYRIVRDLGQGGFGAVFAAEDTRLHNRMVALKRLHPALGADAATLQLFDNEIATLAGLRHDHIVTIYDAGIWQSARFLVMEYIEGPTLAALVEAQGPQPPARVNAWLHAIAQALAYAHDRGVIHRDIKPANLMLETARSRVFVTDFGLAQAVSVSGGSSRSTSTQMMLGTALYRAPEVALTGHTAAADLYSLGVVAFELLTGRPPFTADDPLSLMMLHANQPVPPLPESCPAPLRTIVATLLAKQPDERYADAKALASALAVASVSSPPSPRKHGTSVPPPHPSSHPAAAPQGTGRKAVPGATKDTKAGAPKAVAKDTPQPRRSAGPAPRTPTDAAPSQTRLVVASFGGDHRSIQAAHDAAPDHAVIVVKAGVYMEALQLTKPVTIKSEGDAKRVVIEAARTHAVHMAASCRLDGVTVRLGASREPHSAVFVAAAGCHVVNCILTSAAGPVVTVASGGDAVLRGNRIADGADVGVHLREGSSAQLDANDICNHTRAGLLVEAGCTPDVFGNEIHAGRAGGVVLATGAGGRFVDNTIRDNVNNGMEVGAHAAPVVRGNRINHNGYEAIWVRAQGGGEFSDNDLTDNLRGPWDIERGAQPARRNNRE